MSVNRPGGAAAQRPTHTPTVLGGGPALVIAALVILAALYSFSIRPPPPFAPTEVRPDGLLVTGVAASGDRLVAAGELGHILFADAVEGPWQQATVTPQRESTFTQVQFVSPKVAVAIGHDGWIVRSEDGGQTWAEVHYNTDRADPLLGLAGPYDGTLFAFGAFGLFMVSTDEGRSWTLQPLVEVTAAATTDDDTAAPPAAEADPYDPFAGFVEEVGIGDLHLNALTRLPDGRLLLVGERGLLARSADGGNTWTRLDEIYAGSFFGTLVTPQNALLVFGMRGNVFRSDDGGDSWSAATVPGTLSLFGGAPLADGGIVLVGASNSVWRSDDDGRSFQPAVPDGRANLADVLVLGDRQVLTAGDQGLKVQALAGAAP
ncbi:hypothetical protein JN531_005375 [Flagellatimonas centrodinii]|uniref:WD40/YVTN/BNR-like repeat-containing protein n=1 Tax=Flagellatimonas centrodinii TaxID=2806210 RepID=UPI001FEF6AF7|nr:hypothetical protein [Flagellatimonas centrodinii]ULQ47718.1 hypothetical protein JN531_005375 [Flagellatimonas centrodinii]